MRGVSRPPYTEDEKRIAALMPAEYQMLAAVVMLVTGFESAPPDVQVRWNSGLGADGALL